MTAVNMEMERVFQFTPERYSIIKLNATTKNAMEINGSAITNTAISKVTAVRRIQFFLGILSADLSLIYAQKRQRIGIANIAGANLQLPTCNQRFAPLILYANTGQISNKSSQTPIKYGAVFSNRIIPQK